MAADEARLVEYFAVVGPRVDDAAPIAPNATLEPELLKCWPREPRRCGVPPNAVPRFCFPRRDRCRATSAAFEPFGFESVLTSSDGARLLLVVLVLPRRVDRTPSKSSGSPSVR